MPCGSILKVLGRLTGLASFELSDVSAVAVAFDWITRYRYGMMMAERSLNGVFP
jgi:hypothetical protein